jgi:hypothetical protein
MSLLSICQTVVEEIGEMDPVTYIAGNTDDDAARQLFAFANKVGKELARQYPWQELLSEHTFSTVAATADYALPADFDSMANDTAWDTTTKRRMIGDTNPFRWRALNALAVTTQLRFHYRIRASKLWLYPTPSSVIAMAYDYQSKNWCTSSAGTGQTAFAADTDVSLIPDDLIVLGVKYYYKADNGMDATTAMEEYQRAFSNIKNANLPGGILDMGEAVYQPYAPYQGNFPDVISG